MKNIKTAIEQLSDVMGYRLTAQEVEELIMKKLSAHEPSYTDESEYNQETESGVVIERHCIELNQFETVFNTPWTFDVEVVVTWKDGAGSYGPNDIEFLG